MTIDMQAHDVLHRAGDQIDVPPPPLDAMLGSAARRRRQIAGVVAGLSAAAVVVAVVIVSTGGAGGRLPATTSPAPTTAPGTRLVGMGSAMVSVPQEWATNRVRCGTPMGDTASWGTAGVRLCQIGDAAEVSSLAIVDVAQNDSVLSIAERANVPVRVGDLDAIRTTYKYAPPCPDQGTEQCPYPRFEGTLYFPGLAVAFFASSQQRDIVDAILDSAEAIPDGYLAVPLNATGSELEALGLQVHRGPGIGPDEVAPTDPPVGSVVAVGSSVAIGTTLDDIVPDRSSTLLPPTEPGTRLAGMDGVMVSVPDAWPTDDTACSGPDTSAVVFAHGGPCLRDPAKVAAVYIAPTQSPFAEPWRSMSAATEGPVDGSLRFATTRWGCGSQSDPCPDGFYAGAVALEGVTVWAAGPDDAAVDAILATVARIPDGFVGVPRLPTASKLADVGLNVDLPPDASSDDVLETLPTAGRIVAAGSTVDVTLVHRYPLDFGPSGAMAVGSPVVVCGDTGGAFAAVDVRASDAGSVTLSLVSGGTVVGQSDPAWMFAGQRTLLAVPIAPGLGNGTADVHIRQSTAGGGAQEASRTVSLSSDTASCS